MERELLEKIKEKLNKLIEIISFIYATGKYVDKNYMVYIKNLNKIAEYCLEYNSFDVIDNIYDFFENLKATETTRFVYQDLIVYLENLPSFYLSESSGRK